MGFLRQLLEGIRQTWQRLSLSARVNIVIAVLATMTAILVLVVTGGRPQYVLLYNRLSMEDSSAVQNYLREAGVSFKAQDDGQTVLVPAGKVSDVKRGLFEKGIVPSKQGVAPGFELFDQTDLMANRYLQDVKYMRAIEGELQRQLNEFDFINNSMVMIREAKEELFVSEQKPSKAAVTLDVKRPLSKSEVKMLLSLISSFGGANLSPSNIVLATTDGTTLHVPPTSEFASIANSKLEYIAELEKQREERAVKGMEALGIRAEVKVSAVVEFNSKKEKTSRTEEGTPISEYSTTVTTTSNESVPEGAPGVGANMPPGMKPPGGTETSEETEETITNYQPSTTETETVSEPGEVKQYIVSAIVEGDYKTSEDGTSREYIGLTPERVKTYESHIRAAVGEGRTPTLVTVSDHPFKIEPLAAGLLPPRTSVTMLQEMVLQYGGKLLQVLLVFVGFLFVRRAFLRATAWRPEEEEEVGEMPHASAEDLRRQEVASEVERMSAEEPETVAALLRSWIAEDTLEQEE